MLNRSKIWAAVLLVATFAAGIAVGLGGRTVWARYAHGGPPGQRPGVDRMMAELNEALHLTPVQRDSVRTILKRHWAQMATVWETVRPRFDSMRAQMDSEVVRQLTPEQQVRYRDHVARYRHHAERTNSRGKKP